ncbi:hypothetical protein OG216_34835 [Streptomycetaceae bacterium NBC_01309]
MPHSDTTPTPARPGARPGLGTVQVTTRLGISPLALSRRHSDPGPVQAIADLVRDTARELDRLDAKLLRQLADEARDLADATDDISAHQRAFSTPQARDRGELLRIAVAHETTRTHLARLLDAYTDTAVHAAPGAGGGVASSTAPAP